MVLPQTIITDEQTVHYGHSYFYILLLAKLDAGVWDTPDKAAGN